MNFVNPSRSALRLPLIVLSVVALVVFVTASFGSGVFSAYATSTAPVLSGIQAVNIIGSGAQITWTTDIAADSSVYYGTSTGNVTSYSSSRCDAGGSVTAHCVNLMGLSPSTVYYYKAFSYATGQGYSELYGSPFTSASGGGGTGSIPLGPSNLHLSGTPTSSYIPLAWNDNANNEDKFNVERKLTTDSNYSGQFLAQLNANATTYTDTTVAAGTAYDYRVQACLSGYGCSEYTYLIGVSSATALDTTSPSTPSTFSATLSPTALQINLSWSASTDNVGVTGYKIFRNSQLLTTVSATSYSDTSGLLSGTTYVYYVKAVDAAGNESATSGTASVTTSASSGTAPSAPTTPSPSAYSGAVGTSYVYSTTLAPDADGNTVKATFDWGDGSTSDNSSGLITPSPNGTSVSGSHTWTTSGVYTIKVKAVDSTGLISAWSSTASMTVGTPPASPVVSAVATGSTVLVTWTESAPDLTTGFTLYRRTVGGSLYVSSGQGASVRSYTDSSLPVGAYNYYMQAYNLTGGGTYPIYSGTSNTATVSVASSTDVLADTAVPTTPTGLVATKDAYNEVDLSWTQSSDNVGVTGYNIYRSGNAVWATLGHSSNTTYVDLTVTAGTPYYYAIRAYDAAGNISATTTPLFLNTPAAPTASVSTTTTTTTTPATTSATNIGVTVSSIFGSSYCEGLTAKTPLMLSVSPYGGAYFTLNMITPTSTGGTTAPGTYMLPNGAYRWDAIAYLGYTLSGKTSGDFILSFSCANTATTTMNTMTSTGSTSTSTTTTTTTTIPLGSVPTAPSNLRVGSTPTATAIALLWNDNSSVEDKYNVERKLTTESNYSGVRLVQLSANATTYTDTTVAAGTAYDYRVQACLSGYGCSASVYLIGVKSAPAPVVTTTPSSPVVATEQITPSNTTVTTATAPTASSAETIAATGQYAHYCDDPAHKSECQTYAATQVAMPVVAPVAPTVTADTFTVLQSGGGLLPAGATTPKELQSACTQTQYASSCADLFVSSGVSDRASADKVVAQSLALEAQTEQILSSRIGARAFLDSDNDGITDYDEVNIYRTDPKKADTNGDGISDGAQLLAGTDPLAKVLHPAVVTPPKKGQPTPPVKATSTASVSQQKIAYEDPKFAGNIKSQLLAVTAVAGITTKAESATDATGVKKATTTKVKLEGKALPNSFVTIFVYSEPIVVTVKADASGSWTYTMDKELADGHHEVYSAITDVGGRILAKSEPLPFVKEAAAVSFGAATLLPATTEQAPGFFSGGSLYALLAILVGILGVAFLLIGWMTRRNPSIVPPGVIDEQKND